MATLKPFRALRPPAALARRVASPPYDVVSTKEARDLAAGNPDSFLRVSRPEIDLLPGTDEHADEVYAKGAANLSLERRLGLFAGGFECLEEAEAGPEPAGEHLKKLDELGLHLVEAGDLAALEPLRGRGLGDMLGHGACDLQAPAYRPRPCANTRARPSSASIDIVGPKPIGESTNR